MWPGATLIYVGLAAAGAGLGALQPASFKAATQLVEINVVVRDRHGPVGNLTKDDFKITDAGKAREIAVFSVVSSSGEVAATASLPASTFSNRLAAGTPPSVTVILLDQLNTLIGAGTQPYEEKPNWLDEHSLANARQHLLKFVATLGPNDRVAVYSLGKSLTVLSDFTSDRERLRKVLENYRAVSLTKREDVDPQAVHTPVPGREFNASIDRERQVMAGLINRGRAETTLAALQAIAGHVASIPGRKNLVWLTSNLPFSAMAAARALNRANLAIYPIDARGLLTRSSDGGGVDSAAQEVFSHRNRGGIATSNLEPVGVSSMQELAEATGGRAAIHSNDLEAAVRAAVADAAVTYTLGFYVDSASLDGAFHELKVRLKHGGGGMEVRAPHGYFAMVSGVSGTRDRMREALFTPLESSAIQLLAKVDRKDGELIVTGVIDLHNLGLENRDNMWRGAADIEMVQQDGAGGVLDIWNQRMNLELNQRQYENYLKSGVFFRKAVTPKPGLETLCLLVAEPRGGKIGSLIIAVEKLP